MKAQKFLFISTENGKRVCVCVCACFTLKKWAGIVLKNNIGLSPTRNSMALVDLSLHSVMLFLL